MASLIISANITFNFDSNVLSVTNSKSSINITSNGYTYSSDSIGYDTVTGTWTVSCSDGYIIDTVTNEDSTNYIISNITDNTYTYSASSTNQTIETGINDVINIKTKRANGLTSDIETKLIINEMTDSQFETLKDENGKIPSLANQLIITSDDPTINIQIDNTLSTTSYNPVQNKIITTALEAKIDAHKPSSYNANEIYNNGLYLVSNGSNLPSSNQYGSLFTLPYSNLRNNTQTNYASQIYLPNGDDPEKPNSMFYRNSGLDTWNDWKEIVNTSDKQSITGIKVFDRYKAQVKIANNDIRYFISAPGNYTTTAKHYVVTISQGNDVTAANSNVYTENGKLYSNNSEVMNLSDEQVATGNIKYIQQLKIAINDSETNTSSFRWPIASPVAYNTGKRYLLGTYALNARYSNIDSNVFIENSKLTSKGLILDNCTIQYNSTTNSVDFIFA